jgi:hypothetical protein
MGGVSQDATGLQQIVAKLVSGCMLPKLKALRLDGNKFTDKTSSGLLKGLARVQG